MRFQLWIATLGPAAGLLALACGSNKVQGSFVAADDAGTASSSGGVAAPIGDAGRRDGGGSSNGSIPITSTKLRDGATALIGVTADDQIIYLVAGATASQLSLEAVAAEGGTPEVIEPTFDLATSFAAVNGGAVGYWTNLDDVGLTGTFNVWTKKAGKKAALSTTSSVADFAASDDGSRIAFSVGVTGLLGNFAIADTATVTAAATGFLADADRINLGAFQTCQPQYTFVQQNFFASFCTGAVAAETNARFYHVAPATAVAVRLDDVGAAAGPIQSFFFTDKNGTKVFVASSAAAGTGRIITPPVGAAPGTSVALDDGVGPAGFITDDGQAVVYRTDKGGMRRASTGAVPAPKTIAADAKGLIDVTFDKSRMLYQSVASQAGTNIKSVDTTTENQTGTSLVATATASPIGFTRSGEYVLYLSESSDTGNRLRSQKATGGAAMDLAQNIAGLAPVPVGNGAILIVDAEVQGQTTFTSIVYINAATGDTSPIISEAVPTGGVMFTKTKLVYTRRTATGAGLYVAPMP